MVLASASKKQHGESDERCRARPRTVRRRVERGRKSQLKPRASAATLGKQRMNWINTVFLRAGGLAAAATLLTYALGFGWFSLLVGLLAFIAASLLVPFFLVIRDQRLALKKRIDPGKRRIEPRRRLSGLGLGLTPAVSIGARASLAECGGRVLVALPAAPLNLRAASRVGVNMVHSRLAVA